MSARDTVLLDYCHLSDGETINGEQCPSCRGGISGDRSLSVSNRDGSLLWICYRDTCGFKGRSSGNGTGTGNRTTVPSPRAVIGRWIARESESLPADVQELLASRYRIGAELTASGGFGWDTETDRLVMPVRDVQGQELGVMLRSLSGAKPKVISHTEQGAMAWYRNHTVRHVTIVEDQLSALRASAYSTSVALLGTNLSEERVAIIKNGGFSPVYLALDNDAIASAVKFVVKYRSVLPLRLVRLEKDMKDMTHEELAALYDGLSS